MSDVIDLEMMNAAFRDFVPHNKLLGLTLVEATLDPACAVLHMPFHEQLVGADGMTPHPGAVTTMLDAVCGAAVYVKLQSPTPIATLELRVDFLEPTPPRVELKATAEVVHGPTSGIVFVRARAWVDSPERPFALAMASFALTSVGASPEILAAAERGRTP